MYNEVKSPRTVECLLNLKMYKTESSDFFIVKKTIFYKVNLPPPQNEVFGSNSSFSNGKPHNTSF